MPFGLGIVVDEAGQPSIRGQAVDAARWVVHAGLPLVGQIERARPGEDEIVEALETLGANRLQER